MTFDEARAVELSRFDRAVGTMRGCLEDPGYSNPNHETFRTAEETFRESAQAIFELKLMEWKAGVRKDGLK